MDESVLDEVDSLTLTGDRSVRRWSGTSSTMGDSGWFRFVAGSTASSSELSGFPLSDSHCFSRAD